jgi:hypothetical protein
MKILLILIFSAFMLQGCAQKHMLTKSGASIEDYNKDVARCDYEASLATQNTDYNYRTIIGQELDRANRKNDLILKCMIAYGWTDKIVENSTPSEDMKISWIKDMAKKNGCNNFINITQKEMPENKVQYNAICENKTVDFVCNFNGHITENDGLPFNGNLPACWH